MIKLKRSYYDIRWFLRGLCFPVRWWNFYCLLRSINSRQYQCFTLNSEDVFIVPSCTNPGDWNAAKVKEKSHTALMRHQELCETFQSIRHFYPDAIIFNLESSLLPQWMKEKHITLSDYWIDLSDSLPIKIANSFPNKGIPEVTMLITLLRGIKRGKGVKRIHKLSGRYRLTGCFLTDVSEPGLYLLLYQSHDSVSTRYLVYNEVSIEQILENLQPTLFDMVPGRSLEGVIHRKGSLTKYFVDSLGVCGMINGVDFISE